MIKQDLNKIKRNQSGTRIHYYLKVPMKEYLEELLEGSMDESLNIFLKKSLKEFLKVFLEESEKKNKPGSGRT